MLKVIESPIENLGIERPEAVTAASSSINEG